MNGSGIFGRGLGKGGITRPFKIPKSLPDKKIGVAQKTPKVSNMGSLGNKIGAFEPILLRSFFSSFQVLVRNSWITSSYLSLWVYSFYFPSFPFGLELKFLNLFLAYSSRLTCLLNSAKSVVTS